MALSLRTKIVPRRFVVFEDGFEIDAISLLFKLQDLGETSSYTRGISLSKDVSSHLVQVGAACANDRGSFYAGPLLGQVAIECQELLDKAHEQEDQE